ncbi:hypothetical protein [uncultured Stenotrophomonas sp.]|uniref:hypothetical protein n=1 Tax=uncultured Stenotrophomonas sp. TaxID=165438 RepID=UPI0028E92BB2|nr:hypothetical protein [uncultured Stenotrophomonas sp.]
MESKRWDEVRKRRTLLGDERARAHLRSRHGAALVQAINEAASCNLSIDDFRARSFEWNILWPRDIRDAPGLVRTYVDQAEALRVMQCAERRLGLVEGEIGFHENDDLGFAPVSGFAVTSMVAIAASTGDSALFQSESAGVVMLVDCYGNTADEQFSVLIQGAGGAPGLAVSFPAKR